MEREVVQRAMLGWSNCEISFALGVSGSAVGVHLSNGLKKLGVRSRAELIRLNGRAAYQMSIDVDGDPLLVIAEPGMYPLPASGLSVSEGDILQWIMRGASNKEIALRRESSEKTVANQVAAILRKCGVASRFELIRLVTDATLN